LDSITKAAIHGLVTVNSLVFLSDQWEGDSCPGWLQELLQTLHRQIQVTDDLVHRPERFRGLSPTIPDSVAGVSSPSYHEMARSLSLKVFDDIINSAWFADPVGGFPLHGELPLGPEHFQAITQKWLPVLAWLREKAPRFDRSRLIAQIENEAARSAERASRDSGTPTDSLSDKLANILTPKGLVIVKCLLERPNGIGYDALARVPCAFRDSPSDDSITRALKRVRKQLDRNPEMGLSLIISASKRHVTLDWIASNRADK
jgi:hypothetical protein